jgi:hypothetical protein
MLNLELDLTSFGNEIAELQSLLSQALEMFLDSQMPELESFVHDNNERVWLSRGSTIGADWKGNDLVQTGKLRDSMTSVDLVRVGDTLFWRSDLDYAVHVDERYSIYGADDLLIRRIEERWTIWVEQMLEEAT